MDDRDFDLAGACRAADFYVEMMLILVKGNTSKYDREIEGARARYFSLLFAVGAYYNLEYLQWNHRMVAEEAHKLGLEDFSIENTPPAYFSIYTCLRDNREMENLTELLFDAGDQLPRSACYREKILPVFRRGLSGYMDNFLREQ